MTADILRDKFLEFFRTKKHKIVTSDSLVPAGDPTVLFTPAGMNQFKKQFLGHPSGFSRAATAQRCLRTGDLDKVGETAGHHTFFEMLGNFSFGDYFKEEAITFAWEFLTEELKIDKVKLWVSVYKNDEESYKIWKDEIKINPDKVIKLGDKENFWPSEAKEKGPNGPCGPCSEIFFDRGKATGCGEADCNPSCDCGRFVEVWNLVFTQFNRKEGGILEPLPKKNIDTGMGLERLAAVTQGAASNFETDLFKPIIKEIYSGHQVTRSPGHQELIYAVADHIRAIVFAIYDGVLPSNESRGYVVRKLIRKSILHLRVLGWGKPFLYKLVPIVSQVMKVPYPELDRRRENIAQIILAEEKSFISTLNSSSNLFKDKFSAFLNLPDPQKAGQIVFQLYDTYGIPLELTKGWLDKHHISFSESAFNKELQEQKTRSKSQSKMLGDVFDIKEVNLDVRQTKFLGYKDFETKAQILKIIKDNVSVKRISDGDEATVILDNTVFYPESGGQAGDSGELIKGENIFQVLDTRKIGKVTVHIGKIKQGNLRVGDSVSARIDVERRLSIARNHTATHLLQAALRKVLGVHVQQQGSLVNPEKLRFDFTHFNDVSQDELGRVEETVNRYIIENHPLQVKLMPLPEAKKSGALAFFAEKYEGRARVVAISDISKELCGGTHLKSTGEVGIFKIIQETAVASGIRRIEAITAKAAYKMIKEQANIIAEAASLLNVPKDKVPAEIQRKIAQIKELEKHLIIQKSASLKASIDTNKGELINDINFMTHIDVDRDSVRRAVDLIKEKEKYNTVVVSSTGTNLENQIFLAIGITADLCKARLDASKLIKEIAAEIGGSGGGRKDFAQAGGNNPQNFQKALEKLKDILKSLS